MLTMRPKPRARMPGSTARVSSAGAGQHHRDQEIPALDRELLERRDVLQAGVVDEQVGTFRLDGRDGRVDVRGGVTSSRSAVACEAVAPQRSGSGLDARCVAVGEADAMAAFGEVRRDAEADAAAGTGHERAHGCGRSYVRRRLLSRPGIGPSGFVVAYPRTCA